MKAKQLLITIAAALLLPTAAIAQDTSTTNEKGLVSTIANPSTFAATTGTPWRIEWTGSYVYFGTYDGEPMKYRVLSRRSTDFGGTTMLLDCDSILWEGTNVDGQSSRFDDDSNVWADSELRAYLNGTFLTKYYTTAEQNAIAESVKSSPRVSDGIGHPDLIFTPLSGDKIFLLDAVEVSKGGYGFSGTTDGYALNRSKNGGIGYWLRSRNNTQNDAVGSMSTGKFISGYSITTTEYCGVSPTLNLDLPSVVFSTVVSGTAGEWGAEYKLTVVDSNIEIQTNGAVTRDGDIVSIPYVIGGANSANVTQVSLMVTDNPYKLDGAKLVAYENLGNAGSGTATFTLTEDMKAGSYYYYIVAEDVNGSKQTDYASKPVKISIPSLSVAGNCNYNAIRSGISAISGWYDNYSNNNYNRAYFYVYDYVYYGNWDAENSKATPGPIKWRVLDTKTNMENATEGDGLFLLSEELLGTGDDGGVYSGGGSWQGSGRQAWCKNFYSSSLTIQEQSAVLSTTKTDAEYILDMGELKGKANIPYSENILNGDKVFFLSAEETTSVGNEYGMGPNNSDYEWRFQNVSGFYGVNDKDWWLRSRFYVSEESSVYYPEGDYVGIAGEGFVVVTDLDTRVPARPAMNIDSNSVLFTSAAVGGKSTDGMDSGLTAVVDDYDGKEWKLTILDSNRDFSISNAKIEGNAVTFSYSNAQTGTNEYISALLDNNGAITHYGRILQLDGETNAASGTASFALPVGVTLGESTKLYVFNEQYNGDKMTDHAGYLLEICNSEDDKSAPTLLNSSASRDSETSATVKFVSSEEGTYYYQVVESGAAAPTVEDLTGSTGHPCHGGGTNIINLSELTGDSPKDLYIIIKDAAENISQLHKIEIPIIPTYIISAEPSILDFGCFEEGYTSIPRQDVTIKNIGNHSVIVNLPTDEDYDISAVEGFKSWDGTETLAPGDTAVIAVMPKVGLTAGNYNKTITISGSNGASTSVSLTFAVHAHSLEYRYNATSHWQECSDPQCPFEDKGKTATEAHVYEEGQNICSVCGYYAPYTLTIENGGIGSTGVGNYGEGSDVPIFAGRRAGYRFYSWVSFNGGSFADAYSASTTFTMPAANAAITAVWQADTDADTGKAIQSGADGIAGYWVNDSYDYIYYGNWEAPDEYTTSGPIKWRVLDIYTNTFEDGLFLLSDVLYGSGENGGLYFQQNIHQIHQFDNYHNGDLPSDGNHTNCKLANAWQGSDAQAWCNSFYATCLTSQEQNAVLATTKSDDYYTTSKSTYVRRFAASENILNGDKLFFLSAEEAETDAYGLGSNADRMANYGSSDGSWWLRSPLDLDTRGVGFIDQDGVGVYDVSPSSPLAARPAFNLDLNSVLFTSAATSANGGKADAAVDGNLTAVKNYSGNEWKLTVSDSDRSGFAISDAMKSDDGTIVFSYSNAQTGENEYISAIIESNGAFTYYGRILQLDGTQNGSSGIASLTLPSGVTLGEITRLYVFNEQYNGDYQTDYASPLKDLSNFANISYSGTCGAEGDGSNVKWVLSDDGTLIIYGTGAMKDYALLRPSPWCDYVSSIKKAVIEEGITNLGNYMFYCGIENGNVHCELTSIEIPSSVTRIGNYALVNCSKLANITLPDDLKSIGNVAFGGCQSLTSIDIPSGITTIGEQTFSYCVGLKSINIPSGVTTIDKHAFQGCSSLTSMTVYANTPPALGENVFEDANADLIAYVPYSLVSDYETKWGTNPIEIQGLRATVTAAPSAITGLIDNSQAQALVTEGTAENGTMVYALEDGVYSGNIPTGTDAGEYTVYYKAKGDGITYGDSDEAYVTVSIKAPATAIAETQEITVYAHNGRIYVDAEEYAIYNIIGQNVTTLNGSLHGLYVVVVEGSVVKIRVN